MIKIQKGGGWGRQRGEANNFFGFKNLIFPLCLNIFVFSGIKNKIETIEAKHQLYFVIVLLGFPRLKTFKRFYKIFEEV